MNAIFEKELKFIEQTIPRNPKSYWLWLHREWVTSTMQNCNWERELKLCGKMLDLDERNCIFIFSLSIIICGFIYLNISSSLLVLSSLCSQKIWSFSRV